MDEQLERLLFRFKIVAKKHYAALEAVDEEMTNREAMMLSRLVEAILSRGGAGRSGLLSLTWSEDDCVAGMAAVYCLRHYPERAAAVLRQLALRPGLLGFRASVALERWEKGEWDLD